MTSKPFENCCAVCSTALMHMKRCTRCRGVLYCSRTCQVADWPKHSKFCNNLETNINMKLQEEKNDHDSPRLNVKVLSNHSKVFIKFYDKDLVNGKEAMKKFSSELQIPLSELKLIGIGKIVNEEKICDVLLQDKCKSFQAIGEKSENSEGLDEKDIAELMNKMSVVRNIAIKALRTNNGNIIDAMINM